MLSLKKILLPVDFPLAARAVLHQAATLAHHFRSEIVLLHVVTERSHAAGISSDRHAMVGWDLLAAILRQAKEEQDELLADALGGLAIHRKLLQGDVASAIVQTAHEERADLIMMPSHSFTFTRFLLSSAAAEVLHGAECPVWTGAHVQISPVQNFAIRNVLCAVKFGPRADITVSWAGQMAAQFGARLTLANMTAGVEMWGAGGSYVDQRWKEEIVSNASQQMAKLQQDTGIKADVFIGSGDVPQVLSQAAKQTKADLLVSGCYPYGGHLRTHGYAIISAVHVPVLNV
jgi:nucleotide-binding universal stress UspA family protein